MANLNNPNGFVPYGGPGQIRAYETAASQTIAIGDFVALDGSGQVTIATATSTALLGVAASAVSSSSAGDEILVYDDPYQQFIGQCSGTYAITLAGSEVDIEGTTGIMEVDEDATSYGVLCIMKAAGGTEIGANSQLIVQIAKHVLRPATSQATATVATTVTVTDTTDTSCNVALVESATGNLGVKSDANLTYNAGTGVLTAAGFAGPLTGDVTGNVTGDVTGNVSGSSGSCSGNAATATLAGTVTVADTTDATCSIAMFEDATGSLAPKTDGGLTYDATSGTLTATAFSGPLTGNVTGNASGSSGSCTGNAATATALAAGDQAIVGDLSVSGHVLNQVKLFNSFIEIDSEWVPADDGSYTLPTNNAGKKLLCQLSGLTVGDQIVKFRVVGGLGASAGNHTTVDAILKKITKAAGGVTASNVDAITQVDVEADTALDAEETLAAVETVATDYQYAVLITVTTAADAACDAAIAGVEIEGNFKVA